MQWFRLLLVSKNIIPPTCIKKWTEHFPNFNNANILIWHRIFKQCSVTRDTRLLTCQYLFIHRVIPCDKWICNWKIKRDSGCNLCNDVDDLVYFYTVRILRNSGCTVSKNGKTIYLNLISGKMISLKNVDYGVSRWRRHIPNLNYCVLLALYFTYTIKLNGNNTLDLYT